MARTKVKYRLKGHESFSVRDGWLTKGMMAVKENPKVFTVNFGTDVLGVGSNMAKSIRYWLKACGLTEEVSGKGVFLTEFGEAIYEGDRYLEDEFTIWVLHGNLVSNREYATIWYLFFNKLELREFTRSSLHDAMGVLLEEYIGTEDFSVKTMQDDCNVLLTTYSREKETSGDPEDKRISPFAALGIVRQSQKKYKKELPELKTLSSWAVFYLILGQMGKEMSISIEELLTGENSVGKVACLNRLVLNNYLDTLEAKGYLQVSRTAGLDTVYLLKQMTGEELVREYYRDRQRRNYSGTSYNDNHR